MPRKLPHKAHKSVNHNTTHSLFYLFFIIFSFSSFASITFAQDSPTPTNQEAMKDQRAIDLTVERIRLYYGLGQYSQVLLECRNLEKLDPGNKMARYYQARAETRMLETGQVQTAPSRGTPAFIPRTTPGTMPASTPSPNNQSIPSPFAVPVKTKPPVVGVFPTTLKASTPTPAITGAAPIASPPRATPAPVTPPETRRAGSQKGLKKILQSVDLRYILIGAGGLILLIALIIVVSLIFKKWRAVRKRPEPVVEAQEEMPALTVAEAPPSAFPEEMQLPEVPGDLPPEIPEVPDIPTITKFGEEEEFAPEVPPPVEAPADQMEPPDLEPSDLEPAPLEAPEDIPSPSDAGEPVLSSPIENELPDIPSPANYPEPQAAFAEQAGDISASLPPDLPTLEEEEVNLPFSAPEEGDVSPPSFEPEAPEVSSAPAPEAPPFEEEEGLSLDALSLDEEPEPLSLPGESDSFLEPSPPEAPSIGEPTGILEPAMESKSPDIQSLPEEDSAPGISIEEALGMDLSSEEVIEAPPKVNVQEKPDDSGMSMDLNTFLFDSTSEDQAETILAVPERKEQPSAPPESPGSSLDLEEKQEAESFDSLMFDPEIGQETVLASPGEVSSEQDRESKSVEEEKRTSPFSRPGRMAHLAPLSDQEKEQAVELPPSAIPLSEVIVPEARPVEKEEILADVDFGPHIEIPERPAKFEEAPFLDLKTPSPESVAAAQGKEFLNLDSLRDMGGESGKESKGAPGRTMEQRHQALFDNQLKKGREAFEKGDWKKAVHYLTVASAINADDKDLKELLSVARRNKRALE